MAGANLTLLGAAALKRQLRRSKKEYDRALGKALHREAMIIFAESQELVPVDESILKGSGVVTRVKYDETGDAYVEVGYGTKYALPVHEMPDTTNWTKPGTGAKYLSRPFEKRMIGWKRRVAMNTRKYVLKGRLGFK
jgi:hypothetical protein